MNRSGLAGQWSIPLQKILPSPLSKAAGPSSMITIPAIESREKAPPEEAAKKQIHSYGRVTPIAPPNNQALVLYPRPQSWTLPTIPWIPLQPGLQAMAPSLNLPKPALLILSRPLSLNGEIFCLPQYSPVLSMNPDVMMTLWKKMKNNPYWNLLPASIPTDLVLCALHPGRHFNRSGALVLSAAFPHQALRRAGMRPRN